MATIKHARTLALQATSPRIVAVALPTNVKADWTNNVNGTGKPADYATVNRLTYSASPPGSPVDGDIWVDTSQRRTSSRPAWAVPGWPAATTPPTPRS